MLHPTVFADGPLHSGSLRDAVLQANADPVPGAADTILLSPGTYTLTIGNGVQENAGNTGDLDVTGNSTLHPLVIQGAGPGATVIDATHLGDRAFQIVNPGITVTFSNLAIRGGMALDNGSAGAPPGTTTAQGGAILANNDTVTLNNVVIQNSQALGGPGANGVNGAGSAAGIGHAGGAGGAGFNAQGGGIFTAGGTLTLNAGCALVGTVAVGGNGGGGGNGAAGSLAGGVGGTGGTGGMAQGGGLYTSGTVTNITQSTLSGNRALAGNGGAGGMGGNAGAAASGTGGGGGLGGASGVAQGGGLYAAGGTLSIQTTTVDSNQSVTGAGGNGGAGGADPGASGAGGTGGAGAAGAGAQGGGLYTSGTTLSLQTSTLSRNLAGGGGGGVGGAGGAAHLRAGNGGAGGTGGAGQGGGLYVVGATPAPPLVNDTFGLNNAGGGPGGAGGAGGSSATFGGNGGNGGSGGATSGGGLYVATGNMHVTNITVAQNTAGNSVGGPGGLGHSGGPKGAAGKAGSGTGGGVFGAAGTLVHALNALFGLDTAALAPDFNGSVAASHCLMGNNQGNRLPKVNPNGNLVGTPAAPLNPMLGALGNNGGPTQTLAVLVGSPCISAGRFAGAPALDQRGVVRDNPPNIGAFENDATGQSVLRNPVGSPSDQTARIAALDALLAEWTSTDPGGSRRH